MCEDIQNCCRICLDVESDHVPILSDLKINLHMKSCLAMTISPTDDLPKTICVTCVTQLSEFYNFQLNARCSQDWLESSLEEMSKKTTETKVAIQPLPDSEYNSDSLLEFLNNTANIEEYLNNLGKEDIPSIVNMLDRNQENSMDSLSKTNSKIIKQPSPNKRDKVKHKVDMEIDVLDSDIDIVKEILMKETEPKKTPIKDKILLTCFGCKSKFDNFLKLSHHLSMCDHISRTSVNSNKILNIKQKHSLTHKSGVLIQDTDKIKSGNEKSILTCFACKSKFDHFEKLSQHLSICDNALRTCIQCNLSFDSKLKMRQHSLVHSKLTLTCPCGKQFTSKERLAQHHKTCNMDPVMTGCIYRCKQCHETFKERFQLYKHAKDHVTMAAERICDVCGHSFMGNDALVKHRKVAHGKCENLMYRYQIFIFSCF